MYIKRGKRESRASPPPPPKKARVTCVWKVLVVVVRSFVFARCWSSRGFYTATERMEMKMMLEFWRQNAEAKMVPFPHKKTPLSLRTRV